MINSSRPKWRFFIGANMDDLFFWYCVIVSAVLQYSEWRAKAAKIKHQEDLFIFNVKLWLLARGVNVF
jgi:hypothetical protein